MAGGFLSRITKRRALENRLGISPGGISFPHVSRLWKNLNQKRPRFVKQKRTDAELRAFFLRVTSDATMFSRRTASLLE